jgi:ABC-type multidrug transport system fused ATPase/permease subunit
MCLVELTHVSWTFVPSRGLAKMNQTTAVTAVIDRALKKLREGTFRPMLRCDALFFDAVPLADLTAAINTDVNEVRDIVWGNLQKDR